MAVNSVTAADTSIVIGNTAADPTVRTNTLDVIAADHPPAADWSNNSKKITSLANGSAASDAAALGQVVNSLAATDTSIVVAGTATAPTIATGTLDVIAADHAPAANWSNNSHKITSLASGTAASDAAASTQVWGAQGWGYTPAGVGLAMLTNPPQLCPAQANCTNLQAFFALVTCVQSVTLANIGAFIQTAGITPGAGVNRMAVFAEAGGAALATSSDLTTALQSTGYVEGTISLAVTAGTNYYLMLLTSFTGTIPKVNAVQTTLAATIPFNGHYIGGTLAGQSSVPSLTPSGLSASNSTWCMWAR